MSASRPKRIAVGGVTVRAVRGPKPGARRTWYWQAQRSVDGVRRTIWSGWSTRAEAQRIVLELAADGAGLEDEPPATEVQNLRDVLELWIGAQRDRLEARDITEFGFRNSRIDAKHLAEHIGATAIAQVKRPPMEAYRNARLREGGASATVHRELKSLRTAWKWARGHELVPDRDLPKVRVKVTATRAKYNPTVDEVWRVIDQLEPGWPAFVGRLQALTGARIGEIASLTPASIQSGVLVLNGKSGPRPFPLTPDVRAALAGADLSGGFLTGTTPGVVRGHFSSKHLRGACAAAGVPCFTSHGFRRSAVDALQRAGIDIKTAADLLGHSPEVMLKYYREVSAEDRLQAALRLGAGRASAAASTAGQGTHAGVARTPPTPADQAPSAAPQPAPALADRPPGVTARGYSSDPKVRKGESPQGLTSAAGLRNGTPKGNRTPLSGVRGQRPNR
jgi:integrase